MEWLAEIIAQFLIHVIVNCFLYPFGLLRLWIVGKCKKSFKKIIDENSFWDIALQGRIFMLDVVAGVGALGLTAMVIFSVGLTIYTAIKGIRHP